MAETADIPQITPSPLCNLLLELCRQVHDGEASPELLRQKAQEELASLPAAREETFARIRAEGEAHLRTYAEPIAMLHDSFTDLEGALRETLRYAEGRHESFYQSATERLRQAGISSWRASSAYQQAELAQGPTEMPMVNLLHKLKDGYFKGTVTRENLDQGVNGAIEMARTAADEARRHEPASEARDHLARAYDLFVEALEIVRQSVDAGSSEMAKALDQAADVGRRVRTAMESFNAESATAGPTRMAHANLILTLAHAHRQNGIPDETLTRGIEVFRKSLEDLQTEIESMASIPSDSNKVAEQMEPTRRAFAAHHEALDLWERYVAGERELYDEARQHLIDAAESLGDCKAAFDAIGELEGKVPCVRCGAPNDPHNRSCTKCGAQLLMAGGLPAASSTMSFQEQGGEAQMGGDLVMTENLMRLFETVNAVSEGRIGGNQFEEVLDWFEGLVRDHLLDLSPAPELSREGLTEEQAEQVGQAEERMVAAREEIEIGAQELLGALGTLRTYLEEPDTTHLVEGVRQIRDASIRVQGAQRVIDEIAQAAG